MIEMYESTRTGDYWFPYVVFANAKGPIFQYDGSNWVDVYYDEDLEVYYGGYGNGSNEVDGNTSEADAYNATTTSGIIGNGYQIDETADSAINTGISLSDDDSVSFSCWVKADLSSSNNWPRIVSVGDDGQAKNQDGFGLFIGDGDEDGEYTTVKSYCGDGTEGGAFVVDHSEFDESFDINNGEWWFFVVECDTSSLKFTIYDTSSKSKHEASKDTTEDGRDSIDGFKKGPISIGENSKNNSNLFNGIIDEVRIYNKSSIQNDTLFKQAPTEYTFY